MHVTIIGAKGFVGSAFARLLQSSSDVKLTCVTRENFDSHSSAHSDVVIDTSCNSKKYLAEENPAAEFELSVVHCLKTLQRFPAALQVHISSVDVYSDLTSPATTHEDSPIDLAIVSNYGLHKLLAEQLVRHYAPRWLILRLAGMVGTGLRKNPVFDICHGQPLRVHPDSRYQYMSTDDVARIAWELVTRNISGEIFNICADGTITMREIAKLAGRELNLSLAASRDASRIVEASNGKIHKLFQIPKTYETIKQFVCET
jgi:nucleoside-diphosphate-sugar epimerase